MNAKAAAIGGWAAVALAVVTGVTGGFKWVASDVAKPLTARLIENYNFQEENAKKNSDLLEAQNEAVSAQNAKLDNVDQALNKIDQTLRTIGSQTHENQTALLKTAEKQVDQAKEAAKALKEIAPMINK